MSGHKLISTRSIISCFRAVRAAFAIPVGSPQDSAGRVVLSNILTIGAGLSSSKELRDIFEDIVAKVVEPCRASDLAVTTVSELLHAFVAEYSALKTLTVETKTRFLPTVTRLFMGITEAVLRLYRAI